MNTNLKKILGLIAIVVIIIVVVLVVSGGGGQLNQEVSTDDPITITLDFYESWLEALSSTSTDPYALGLADAPILGQKLRAKLKDMEGYEETEPDPVLCQTKRPEGFSTRPVFEREEEAQVLVMSSDREQPEQAIISLTKHKGGWYISDIYCSPGEVPPDREFTFEQEGFLLKSVAPPLNPEYWHLVFEVDGVPGHVAPLFFDGASKCTDLEGKEGACDSSKFVEPTRAYIKGQMTEAGVEVNHLEFRK